MNLPPRGWLHFDGAREVENQLVQVFALQHELVRHSSDCLHCGELNYANDLIHQCFLQVGRQLDAEHGDLEKSWMRMCQHSDRSKTMRELVPSPFQQNQRSYWIFETECDDDDGGFGYCPSVMEKSWMCELANRDFDLELQC
jgi:hypothetical protein